MTALDELLGGAYAHRGLHHTRTPENSMAAFEAAIARGLGIELDVRLSLDGVPVVFHDRTLGRVCGYDLEVSQLTAGRLTRLRLRDSEQTIPTLTAALRLIGDRVPVLVDVKSSLRARGRLADAVAIITRAHPGPVGFVCADPWLLRALSTRAPRVPRGHSAGLELWSWPLSLPDFVSCNVDRLPVTAVEKVRRQLPVVAWTVRTAAGLRTAQQCADAVIVEGAAVDIVAPAPAAA